MPDIACLNGKFSPLAETLVPVNDRGYLFGDGVYEVIRTYGGGEPFGLDHHLDRLDRSLKEVRIAPKWSRSRLVSWIGQAVARADYADAKIYLQVTRGVAPREHTFPDVPPTTLITVSEIHPLPADLVENGAALITALDIRWGRCDIKSLNLLPNVMARQAAAESGAFEAIFIEQGTGNVREGAGSNVFAVIDGAVVTPEVGPNLLAGITRAHLLHVASELGLPTAERVLHVDDLMTADEVFLTGTTIDVLGVSLIDGQPIGEGRPGPITRKLAEAFPPK